MQPLSQNSMQQEAVIKEACKLSLKAGLSQELHSYIKIANHLIENLTDNGEHQKQLWWTTPYNINLVWEPALVNST